MEDNNDDRRLEISGLCPCYLIDRRRSQGEQALNTVTTTSNTSNTKTSNTSVAYTNSSTTTLRVSLRSIPISGGQSGLLGVRCLGKSRRNL